MVDFALQSKWRKIPESDRELLLDNAYCFNCGTGSFRSDYRIRSVSNGDIAIDGICKGCEAEICRVVEKDWFM